jgi:hypothetical protein
MPWTFNKPGREHGDSTLIMDGSRVAGSIARVAPVVGGDVLVWRVEVLWSGPNITFEAETFEQAEAFMRGVEAALGAVFGVFGRYLDSFRPSEATT